MLPEKFTPKTVKGQKNVANLTYSQPFESIPHPNIASM